jgi:pilus assembly protein CpaB
MNRDTRMWIVVGIAVLTAALASFGMYRVIANQTKVVEVPKVFVVVAKKNLEMGSVVAEPDVRLVNWPPDSRVPGALDSIDQVKNKSLIASVLENEPITKSKLAEAGSGLAPIIRNGMRAMSIKVNEVIGVAGFVTPGTRVDVLVTVRQDRDSMSRVVVQNVEVLTAGAKYDDPESRKQGKPIPSTFVTLMVWPDQAERIALASTEGQIMLALRNPLDTKSIETNGVRSDEMMRRPTAAPPTPPPGAPPRKAAQVVRIVESPKPIAPPCRLETFKAGKREVLPCT